MSEHSHHSSSRKSQRTTAEKLLPVIMTTLGIVFLIIAFWNSAVTSYTFSDVLHFIVDQIRSSIDLSSQGPVISVITLSHGGSTKFVIPVLLCSGFVIAGAIAAPKIRSLALQAATTLLWMLFTIWLIAEFMMTNETFLYISFLVSTTIIFLTLFTANLNDNHNSSRRRKRHLEFILIFANSGFYFLAVFVVLNYCGYNYLYLPFTALLAAFNMAALYYYSVRGLIYQRTPYILFTILVCSVVPPAIFMFHYLLFFFTTLSVLALIFGKYTNNRLVILISYVFLLASLVVYITTFTFEMLPAMYLNPLPVSGTAFFRGFTATAFILAAMIVFLKISRNIRSPRPESVFSPSSYRKRLRICIICLFFTGGLFIWFGLITNILPNPRVRFVISTSFLFIFLNALICYFSLRRKQFLRATLVASSIITTLYIMSVGVFDKLINLLHGDITQYFKEGVVFHYLGVVFFIMLIVTVMIYIPTVFRGKKSILGIFSIWFAAMIVFTLMTEVGHLMVMRGFEQNIPAADSLHRMYQTPGSVITAVASIGLLVTGVVKHSRILRIFSLVMLLCIALKIIFYDLSEMNSGSRSLWFMFLGGLLILTSLVYNRQRKKR